MVLSLVYSKKIFDKKIFIHNVMSKFQNSGSGSGARRGPGSGYVIFRVHCLTLVTNVWWNSR